MEYSPNRGILVNDDTELIVGGFNGNMSKYSLKTPAAPALISIIKLSNHVCSIVKMTEDILLCG